MLQDMSVSVSNLASNAVADATISASLNIATLQSSNEDAWHSLGAHHRSCLQSISDNQNKNHVVINQNSALLLTVCSKLEARHSVVENLQQDIDFISESKNSLSSMASELASMSQELISLTNFLAVFREVHISRSVIGMKNDADADLLRAQKTSHSLITAAARARDLNLDKSINSSRTAVSITSARPSSSVPPLAVPPTVDFSQQGPESQVDHVSDASDKAPEEISVPTSVEGTGEQVVIDFEKILESEPNGASPIDSTQAADDTTAGE